MRDWAKEIEDDLNWREAELASFKVLVFSAPKGSVRATALLRGLWTILYAHYEGFCKFAWDLYLDALEKEGVLRSACRDNIACLSLEKDFKRLKGNLSAESIWAFCTAQFPQLLSEPAAFRIKLETQSNLWPQVYCENARRISVPTTMMDENTTRIRTLVARRNEIAHGRKMIVSDIAEYQRYEDAALLIMHELAVSILDALEKKKHLR